MSSGCRALLLSFFLILNSYFPTSLPAAEPKSSGRVTQIIHEVNILEAAVAARRAVLNENVGEGTAVRTGGDSRAELTFLHLTITRLGANSLYSFRRAGRQGDLKSGSTLLRVPKNSVGGVILSPGISAAVTGTTIIFEHTRSGESRLTVLEGTARLALTSRADQRRDLRAGQTLQVPAGATRLPEPTEIDLDQLVRTSPLIVGFRPLPSQDLINQAIKQQRDRGPLNRNSPNAPRAPQKAPGPQAPAAPPPAPGPR